jgi:hypothetical protein
MTKDHVQLVTYSQGVVADYEEKNGIAPFLAPEVVTGGGIYHYKDYGLGNAFTSIEMRRAIGGATKMLALSVNDLSNINLEYGLSTFIDDQERENNPVNITVLEQRKIKDLVHTAMNNNLYMVLQTARTLSNIANATGGTNPPGLASPITGAWSAQVSGVYTNDPVNEINIACKYIADTYGILPNRIYFDSGAWLKYQNNQNVKGRFQGVLVQAVTPENTKQLWNIPLDPRVNMGALYEGGSGFNDVIIFFGQDGPSQFDTSFMKTFVNVAGRFTRVRSWRDEETSSDKYKVQWFQSIKLTGQATAVRMTIS